MRTNSSERFPFLRANRESKSLIKWYQKIIDNNKGDISSYICLIFGVMKGFFDIIVKEMELFVRKGNTKITYLIDVMKKGGAIYHLRLILTMKHHIDTCRIPFRNR